MADQGGAPAAPKPDYPSVTVNGKCPDCPECAKVKKKPKPKGRKPIFEIVLGVLAFAFIIISTDRKLEKEKKASEADKKEYVAVQPQKIKKKESPPSTPKPAKIDLSNFSDLEQQYIKDSCEGKEGVHYQKCVRKSINELLDLY